MLLVQAFARVKKAKLGDVAYISFATAEDKQKALNTLDGLQFK